MGIEYGMPLLMYVLALLPLLYSLPLPPVGPHDNSISLIHLQALGILRYSSHPPTLPIIVRFIYGLLGPDYVIVRAIALLFAPLLPLSTWLISRNYGREVALLSFGLATLSPLYIVYGKAPLYALFGLSLGSMALALHINGRMGLSHTVAATSLLMDWTALPFVLPVIHSLKKRWRYALLYIPTMTIYLLWIWSFTDRASVEFAQRFPSVKDVLVVFPLALLRLLIFLPIPTLMSLDTVRKVGVPNEMRTPLLIQIAFVLLWADFYVHHTPYLLAFLPFLSTLAALNLRVRGKIAKVLTFVLNTAYTILVGVVFIFPYAKFSQSPAGCILMRLNRTKSGALIYLPEEGAPKSLRLLLTLVRPDTSAKIVISYRGIEGGKRYVLYGDTLYIYGISPCGRRRSDGWVRATGTLFRQYEVLRERLKVMLRLSGT